MREGKFTFLTDWRLNSLSARRVLFSTKMLIQIHCIPGFLEYKVLDVTLFKILDCIALIFNLGVSGQRRFEQRGDPKNL